MPAARSGFFHRLPLAAILGVTLVAELAVNRVGGPLLHRELLTPPGCLRDGVDWAGLFLQHFSSLLAILLAVIGLVRFLVFSTTVPRGAKAGLGALATAFVPLVLVGAFFRLPPLLMVYLEATFAALAMLLALAGFLTRARPRTKLGLLLLAVPYLLHFVAAAHLARHPGAEEAVRGLLRYGEIAIVVAALSGLALLWPAGGRWVLPVTVATPLAAVTGLVFVVDHERAARLVGYGVGVLVPDGWLGAGLAAMVVWAWVALVLVLVAEPGRARLRGVGLLIVGLAGFRLAQPGAIAAALVGVLCLVGSVEGDGTTTLWRAMVDRLAGLLDQPAIEAGGDPGDERARIVGRHAGVEASIRVAQRAGRLDALELTLGAPASREPTVVVRERDAPSLGSSVGPVVGTGDAEFDRRFVIEDRRRLGGRDTLLTDEVRDMVMGVGEGWLAVWPGAAARHRVRGGRLLGPLLGGDQAALDDVRGILGLLERLRAAG